MAKIALKVDVDTLRGTKEGVPNLARTLERFGLKATFLFSLGPDHTGWALKRVFRPGFLKKVSRTSVVEHYGIKTLLYGVLIPGPDIGKKAAAEMRAIDQAGHETGRRPGTEGTLHRAAQVRGHADGTVGVDSARTHCFGAAGRDSSPPRRRREICHPLRLYVSSMDRTMS